MFKTKSQKWGEKEKNPKNLHKKLNQEQTLLFCYQQLQDTCVWQQNKNSTKEMVLILSVCMIIPTGSGHAQNLEVGHLWLQNDDNPRARRLALQQKNPELF